LIGLFQLLPDGVTLHPCAQVRLGWSGLAVAPDKLVQHGVECRVPVSLTDQPGGRFERFLGEAWE
jgi:hypothetical protein